MFDYTIEKEQMFKKGEVTMKYRVANRFRFTVFVVIMIIMLTAVSNLVLGLNKVDGSTIQEYKTVEIFSGDTLWAIAQQYMPYEADTQKAVYEICRINDINASQLQAGMTIQVPING